MRGHCQNIIGWSGSFQRTVCIITLGIFLVVVINGLAAREAGEECKTGCLTFKEVLDRFRTPTDHGIQHVVLRNENQARNFLRRHEMALRSRGNSSPLKIPNDLSATIHDHPLLTIDYENILVVGVFGRPRPNTSYSMRTKAVTQKDKNIRVQVVETGSASGGQAVVYPAQFITLRKSQVGKRSIDVELRRVCRRSPCVWENGYK